MREFCMSGSARGPVRLSTLGRPYRNLHSIYGTPKQIHGCVFPWRSEPSPAARATRPQVEARSNQQRADARRARFERSPRHPQQDSCRCWRSSRGRKVAAAARPGVIRHRAFLRKGLAFANDATVFCPQRVRFSWTTGLFSIEELCDFVPTSNVICDGMLQPSSEP